MGKTVLFLIFWLLPALAMADYSIDLSRIKAPKLDYLNMGDGGTGSRQIKVNNLYLEIGGKPQLPVMGEMHFSRTDERFWRDTLLKMKASGVNIVATYCIWSLHEETEGEMTWEGNRDLRRFLELCKEVGLLVHLRIGPYCNAEIHNGGLPEWIVNNKNLHIRSNDPLYLEYAGRWYDAIAAQMDGMLYKDGGPVMAIQLENEYAYPGKVISHLTTLKKMARERGMDVPIYTMTHWMDSEYPKGEIVPYAGFYIEAPWTTRGKEEMPVSNFEFFTYNRLSDNIGTDIIKIDGEVESLSGENNDSPFFTCEIGVGTTNFYHRRARVPADMAGENISLRLGCGANLMGYYMYVGGTNPVGERRTFESSGPRVSYDYQAPIREYGTLGDVMGVTRKYNYFMNDFGGAMAPQVAYLPRSNQNRDNLQWGVRMNDGSGYLFCSNYIYRHHRKDYRNVRFDLKLPGETLRIPSKPLTVRDGAYFHWPFNLDLGPARLKYATAQPLCRVDDDGTTTYFFFEDDGIPAEYLIEGRNAVVEGSDCEISREKNGRWFVDGIHAGKNSMFEIKTADGKPVRIVTLTAEESDRLWKEHAGARDVVLLTESSVIFGDDGVTLIDSAPSASLWEYSNGAFHEKTYTAVPVGKPDIKVKPVLPFSGSKRIWAADGGGAGRDFMLATRSEVQKAFLRVIPANAECDVNGTKVALKNLGNYGYAEVGSLVRPGENRILFPETGKGVEAEIEVLLTNGRRIVWNTDGTWLTADKKAPVEYTDSKALNGGYAPEEHLAVYEITVPETGHNGETRLAVDYRGDVANAYIEGELVADSYYNGEPWTIGIDRLPSKITHTPLLLRIDGLQSADADIYFEKDVDVAGCVNPSVKAVDYCPEYRFLHRID